MRKLLANSSNGSIILAAVALAVVIALAAFGTVNRVSAQALPNGPYIYTGAATVNGQPAPDGYTIHATVGDYQSEPVPIAGGKYEGLVVAPSGTSYQNQTVMFYLGDVPANETDQYRLSGLPVPKVDFDLTFPSLPVPTPTPTPDIPPTATPTATPEVPAPMIFASGNVFLTGGGTLPEGAQLTARIGDYTSGPATILTKDGQFADLLVDPQDNAAVGRDILFFIDGKAARTTEPFVGGQTLRNFDIVFTVEFATATPVPTNTPPPTATPEPTATPVPPTATPEPTATPVPPTATPVPPTATPEPTATPVPPTATPEPTATPVPPTATPVPPTATPEPPSAATTSAPADPAATTAPEPESNGGCNSPGPVSPSAAAANALLLIAPLGVVAWLRRRKV